MASKIESCGGVAQGGEGLGQRLHDLVVECPALKRVGMRDERDASHRAFGNIERDFERAGGAGDGAATLAPGQIFSLSTTRPFTMHLCPRKLTIPGQRKLFCETIRLPPFIQCATDAGCFFA